MTFRIELGAKQPAETQLVQFDYTSFLNLAETISTQVVTCAVWSGVDASPSSMISGAATNASGVVSQLITGGIVGVFYILTCTVTTSLGQILTATAFLVVRAAQP